MPRLDTPREARAWIKARAAVQRTKPARFPYHFAQAEPLLELFWNAPLGLYRPCGCPCDVAVFGHTRCPLAPR